MKSERIEFIRFDDLATGILIGGKPYILTYGKSLLSKQVITPYNQIDLLEKISNVLRYDNDKVISKETKQESIEEISDTIKGFIRDLEILPQDISHLELFLNPSELALLPFELLLNKEKKPYFLKDNKQQLLITRNFRRKEKIKTIILPRLPRVLFVHSKPRHKNYLNQFFSDIPHKDHAYHLKKSLKYWGEITPYYTELDNATFNEFKEEIYKGIEEENPYTHIHILAHGSLIFDYKSPSNFEYGIAFYSRELDSEYKATSAEEIKTLFNDIEDKNNLPYFVNYMICDGANFVNGMKANKNPVQVTFDAGVSTVLGSQFPLSMKGSTYITSELYKSLFIGEDIRITLMRIKEVLYSQQDKYGHDWGSLTSYIQFPDNYNLQLIRMKNELQLTVLNTLRDKKNGDELSKDDFIRIKLQVKDSIEILAFNITSAKLSQDILPEKHILESSGLIASAYKRLAEAEFREGKQYNENTFKDQKALLSESKDWYLKTSKMNLSHYWSISQYVSLSLILEGENSENKTYWNICNIAALNDIDENTNSYWAYGALLELNLLSDISDNLQMKKKETMKYAENLVKNAVKSKEFIAIKSTKLQLERYLNWWQNDGFKIPKQFLIMDEIFLEEIIKKLNTGYN